MTSDQLDARHRLAARVLLRWPRQLNNLIEDTMFLTPFSWVAVLGVGVLVLLGVGVAGLVEHLSGHPIADVHFIGAFLGLAMGCLIAGWMMLGLAIGWQVKRVASSPSQSPRVTRARQMLAAAATDQPPDPQARRAAP